MPSKRNSAAYSKKHSGGSKYYDVRWDDYVEFDESSWRMWINMAGWTMTDEVMDSWCSWFKGYLKSICEGYYDGVVAVEVNFADNHLTARGARCLLETLAKRSIPVQVIKLYRNYIEEGSAIAEYLTQCRGTLRELHLSHNELGTADIAEIVLAVASAQDASGAWAYPASQGAGHNGLAPLWMRIEQNYVDAKALLKDIPRVCSRLQRQGSILCQARGARCTPHCCVAKVVHLPAIHVKHMELQRFAGSKQNDEDVRAAICDALLDIREEAHASVASSSTRGKGSKGKGKGGRKSKETLSIDEVCLQEMEEREDQERGDDCFNEDTFGTDVIGSGWSFEENLAANQRLRKKAPSFSEQQDLAVNAEAIAALKEAQLKRTCPDEQIVEEPYDWQDDGDTEQYVQHNWKPPQQHQEHAESEHIRILKRSPQEHTEREHIRILQRSPQEKTESEHIRILQRSPQEHAESEHSSTLQHQRDRLNSEHDSEKKSNSSKDSKPDPSPAKKVWQAAYSDRGQAIDAGINALLLAVPVLQLNDFDGLVKQQLHAIKGKLGPDGVKAALQAVADATSTKERHDVQRWPSFLFRLLKNYRKNNRAVAAAIIDRECESTIAEDAEHQAVAAPPVPAGSLLQTPPPEGACEPLPSSPENAAEPAASLLYQ